MGSGRDKRKKAKGAKAGHGAEKTARKTDLNEGKATRRAVKKTAVRGFSCLHILHLRGPGTLSETLLSNPDSNLVSSCVQYGSKTAKRKTRNSCCRKARTTWTVCWLNLSSRRHNETALLPSRTVSHRHLVFLPPSLRSRARFDHPGLLVPVLCEGDSDELAVATSARSTAPPSEALV